MLFDLILLGSGTWGGGPKGEEEKESWKLLFMQGDYGLMRSRQYKHISDQGQVYFNGNSTSASIDFVICGLVKRFDLNRCHSVVKKENMTVSIADTPRQDIDVCVLYVENEARMEIFPIYIQDETEKNQFIDSINRISQPPNVCPLVGLKFNRNAERDRSEESKIEGLPDDEPNQLILEDDDLKVILPPFPPVSFPFSELESCAESDDKKGLRITLRESKKVFFFPEIIDVKLKLKDMNESTKLFMVERASQLHALKLRG